MICFARSMFPRKIKDVLWAISIPRWMLYRGIMVVYCHLVSCFSCWGISMGFFWADSACRPWWACITGWTIQFRPFLYIIAPLFIQLWKKYDPALLISSWTFRFNSLTSSSLDLQARIILFSTCTLEFESWASYCVSTRRHTLKFCPIYYRLFSS